MTKKNLKNLEIRWKYRNFALEKEMVIGIWCNGNTADSGPAFPGSSPGIPTQEIVK